MFKRLLNALTGATAEAGDAIMDTNVMQNAEVRGATDKMESELKSARQNEAKIGGLLNTGKRELAQLTKKFETYQNAIGKALDNDDEAKAIEFSADAEMVQTEVDCKQKEVDQYVSALAAQKKAISKLNSNLKLVQRETKGLQAQKAVTKARKASAASRTIVSGEDSDNALAVIRKQREKVSAEGDKLDYMEEQSDAASAEVSASDYLAESSGSILLEKMKAERAAKNA